jgi:BirA family biotin operon repressor/biotin-[acetyl-CoA-carboxylase] ligase
MTDIYATTPSRPGAPDPSRRLDPVRLAALLEGAARDWSIEIVEETGSTNADLVSRVKDASRQADGSGPGTGHPAPALLPIVRLAYGQTAGRGRRGRPWLATPGDALLFSLAYPLARPLSGLAGLSLAVGTAIVGGLRALPLDGARRLALKWPNDVLLDGAKLAGILIETAPSTGASSATAASVVVIGIGINLHGAAGLAKRLDGLAAGPHSAHSPHAAPLAAARPASLSQALPAVVMTDVFAQVLNALGTALARFNAAGFGPFRDAWMADHAYAGLAVSLVEQDGAQLRTVAEGLARGVDSSGCLLIEGARGVQAVASGDVSLRVADRTAPIDNDAIAARDEAPAARPAGAEAVAGAPAGPDERDGRGAPQ